MDANYERTHFTTLARYNAKANETLYGLLAALPGEEFEKPHGSYFISIKGILSHLITADINWLRRFRENFGDMELFSHPRLAPAGHAWTVYEFVSLRELARDRVVVDGLYSRFATEAGLERFGEALAYADSHGNPRRYVFRQILDHVFNHQTHHRGQVSQILDELGVEHDFSNILSVLDPA